MQHDDDPPSNGLSARVDEIAVQLARARFAGAAPQVVVPGDAPASEIVAHALVAERLGLPLLLDGQAHQLHDQRALDALQAAQTALGRWSFGQAEAQLERAAGIAADPATQQRLALWRALAALNRRLVRAHPDARLRGDPASSVSEILGTADQLSAAERDHYRAEAARLLALHRAAGQQPDSLERALWFVVRTRLAMPGDDPLAGLAWCLRLSREFAGRLPSDDEYLHGLLAQARDFGLLAFGQLDDQAEAAARESTAKLQAWDVFRAVTAHLGASFGVDLQREAARFTIQPYQHPDDGDDD
jgi:hypothetical protein